MKPDPDVQGLDAEAVRWTRRPDGSNWGDFGPDDEIGRLNLLTEAHLCAAAKEVREGKNFCLSLPLDCPRNVSLNPRRFSPVLEFSRRGDEPVCGWPMDRIHPGQTDVICDDRVTLSTQYSTQWDALCHIGQVYDAHGHGVRAATFYNGFHSNVHICGPVDYQHGNAPVDGPYGARKLGIDTLAQTCMQGRGVMIDLHAHFGLASHAVSFAELEHIMQIDKVEVGEGDFVCFRTGFDRALMERYDDASAPFDPHACAGLDGRDRRLLEWVTDSGLVALISDNEAVEVLPDPKSYEGIGSRIPLHEHCLFKLGIPLGEMFLLSDLADWLRAADRSRFLLTAPPLRLPGAVGSPVTGVATV
jgi:kynurenine formamidase